MISSKGKSVFLVAKGKLLIRTFFISHTKYTVNTDREQLKKTWFTYKIVELPQHGMLNLLCLYVKAINQINETKENETNVWVQWLWKVREYMQWFNKDPLANSL